jgi:hypothetical protein
VTVRAAQPAQTKSTTTHITKKATQWVASSEMVGRAG